MSEISEIEIKSMTKEENYMRGYEDGKSDVLDKIKQIICNITAEYDTETIHVDRLIYEIENLPTIILGVESESQESETWNGIHAQITAPKGTFERIFNEADDDNDI